MQEALMIIIGSLVGTIVLGSFFVVLLVLFPKPLRMTADAARRMHGRSLVLGFVNLTFFAVLAVALNAFGEGGGGPIIRVLGLLLLTVLLAGVSFGLAGMGLLIGERISPDRTEIYQVAVGTVAVWFSSLTPYLGWFLLFPYLCFRGVGGLFLAVFRSKELDPVVSSD